MARKYTLSPAQDMAANPRENIWVQANAGTGKTSVLVMRLLCILFGANGVGAGGVLCLTYTNAGAGEMRNRILDALRGWAMATDDELRDMLIGISENNPPTDTDIAHAREIFFNYIDNPDILKIKTIHGFCEEILHRFPLEAGVSPSWTLVSDANQRVLQQDAFDRLINGSDDARVANAFAYIVGRVSENYLTDLLAILSEQYKYFFQVENLDKYREYFIDTTQIFLNVKNAVSDDVSTEILENIVFQAESEVKTAKKPAGYLIKIIELTKKYIDKTIDFEEYQSAYLTDAGTPIKNVSKKDYLVGEQERVYRVAQYKLSRQIFDDSLALFDLSAAFAKTYRDMKRQKNLLDFEDLILYTRRLFSKPDVMGWVLSQLDLSLHHILVDEAQDTSPMQWDILRMLSADFFVGGDTVDDLHSIFVVGDTKQSIYAFQGADPRAFSASRDDISAQIKNNVRRIRNVALGQSFRSLPAILRTVDAFFGDASIARDMNFENNPHECFRTAPDGMVEVHKLISKMDDEVDVTEYIRMIADKIKSLIDSGKYAPHDIMILVQQRQPMAPQMVAELKRRGIDVAGSDRIVLPNFPPIRDLMNLVRFCLDTTDDYSLCCVLKSPIFRLKEVDIFNLCKTRTNETKTRRAHDKDAAPVTVWDVLENAQPDIYLRLNQMLEWSKTLAPYSFFTNVLDSGVRAEMISALGGQVIDPLEEFMTICLAYERTQPGGLRHFIKWFITGGSEIKRDMDAASGVRVATVHGSKGLEAPVVFLIDTTRTPSGENILPITPDMVPGISRVTAEMFPNAWLWSPRADASSARATAADALMQIRIEEYYRLLYVAMTRARDRLYIYGFTSHKNAPEVSWHANLWRVLSGATCATQTGDVIRIGND